MFKAHVADFVEKALRRKNTDLVVIPGGLTSILLLDVSINKPFNDIVRNFFESVVLNWDKVFTKGGNMKVPSLVTVCEWARDAWKQLDPAVIV